MGLVKPFRYGSEEHAEAARERLEERAQERRWERQDMHRRRRQALLWRPLAALGAVLLVWQVTSWEPIPLLVVLGLVMCLPLVVDV